MVIAALRGFKGGFFRLLAPMQKYFSHLYTILFSDHVYDGAAVLSFYFLLSIFPGILVLLSIISYIPYELITDEAVLWWISHAPQPIEKLVYKVLTDLGGQERGGLLSFGFLVALWTASSGMAAIIRQLNIAYKAKEKRSYFKIRFTALMLASAVGGFIFVPVGLLFLLNVFSFFIGGSLVEDMLYLSELPFIKYIFLAALLVCLFSIIYYFGPNVRQKFRLLTPGSILGALLLVLSTKVFGIYLSNFANYSAVYGSVGAVVILLIWFYLLGMLIILGAELNQVFISGSSRSKQKS